MSTTRTIRRAMGVGTTVLALTAAVAVTQATGGAATTAPADPTRAEALLAATQAELADTQHRVGTIQLEHVIDGREVYALGGPATACILIAGQDQADGRSQSLACTDDDQAVPERPMRTGFPTASGQGYVDLTWVGGAPPSQVATSGAATDVRIGTWVIAAVRTDDGAGGGLAWQAPAGESVTVPLPSRAERAALVAPAE
ncbi:MAG: hypothetical protein ITG02_03010 [Patulibacter sp.]|nr:hypothetical protein [Patulibacter sp.]